MPTAEKCIYSRLFAYPFKLMGHKNNMDKGRY
jgi:hypothetical protein